MFKRIALAASAALVLAGCAGNPPTAQAFREAASGGHPLTKTDKFEVDRPLAVVAASWRKRAPDCLQYEMYSQQKPVIGFAGSPHLYATSKATVVATPQKAELHLQVHSVGNLASEPDGGMYMFIADAEAAGPGKTRINVYRTRINSDVILEAVRGWAAGTTQACPDPKSFM